MRPLKKTAIGRSLSVVVFLFSAPAWGTQNETDYGVRYEELFSFSSFWQSASNETNYRFDLFQDGWVDARDLLLLLKGRTPGSLDMISVPGGGFSMGARDDGDDGQYAASNEYPRHPVTLSSYQIAKYEVTNGQYSDVLNWAHARGYLESSTGGAYWGGEVYRNQQRLLDLEDERCQIAYRQGSFLPGALEGHFMGNHPVTELSWYGAVAFCCWLSEKEGLTPCYNLSDWSLTTPCPDGYRLPTEAEWERAASWDGSKHWIYSYASDERPTGSRCNFSGVNPLGFSVFVHTSPVGWFNGLNVSPNGDVQTVNSVSPVGCYDMSGNVWEWCHDWLGVDYYEGGAMTNPTGPSQGSHKVCRGGSWINDFSSCRSARRTAYYPYGCASFIGFRVARSASQGSS